MHHSWLLKVLIPFFFGPVLHAGSWAGSGGGGPLGFYVLETGEMSHYPAPLWFSALQIDNEADFEIFWSAHTGHRLEPVPHVDFSSSDVVVIFSNRRGANSISTFGLSSELLVYESFPDCRCPRPDDSTPAYQVIVTEQKLTAPLSFRRGGRRWVCNGAVCADLPNRWQE